MKLITDSRWDTAVIEGSANRVMVFAEVVRREGEQAIRDEIIRRVNAHEALVTALQEAVEFIEAYEPTLTATKREWKAALALAAASETRTEATPDAKTDTQGGE